MPFEKSPVPQPSTSQPSAPVETGAPPAFRRPASLPLRTVCRIVSRITGEMVSLVGMRVQVRADRRRALCHVRQIAMYLCHVALEIPLRDVGRAFGRDRTTVSHACAVVEDRRDEAAFDDLVGTLERIVGSIFVRPEMVWHD